jgi:hypothetical protein
MNFEKGVGVFARHSCSSIFGGRSLSEGRNEPAGKRPEGLREMKVESNPGSLGALNTPSASLKRGSRTVLRPGFGKSIEAEHADRLSC